MKKIISLCFIIVSLIAFKSMGQGMYMQDVNGRPLLTSVYENVSGSPYLSPEWITGKVIMSDAKTYEGVSLKYDQINDDVIFKGKDGTALAVDHVKEFKLAPYGEIADSTVFRSGFPAVKSNSAKSFYEVMVDGKSKLLKKTIKTINTSREYNSATVDKTVVATTNYYLVNQAGNIVFISKDKKSVLKELPGKEAELNAFIASNKLNLKNDADLVKLVVYYNSL